MLKKILSAIDKVEEFLLISMFIGMVGIIFFQVIMRFVFNNSLSWSEELGKFLFVWISWLGISIGHRQNEHIRISMFTDKLPYKGKKLMEVIAEILLIIICAITLYYAAKLMVIQKNIPYAGIKISTSWGYLSLVLGCGLIIARALIYLIKDVQAIRKPISKEGVSE